MSRQLRLLQKLVRGIVQEFERWGRSSGEFN